MYHFKNSFFPNSLIIHRAKYIFSIDMFCLYHFGAKIHGVLNSRTPSRIGDHLYIDGGVGGNCPLAQAIPRMRELSKGGHPHSVLSISPPQFNCGK